MVGLAEDIDLAGGDADQVADGADDRRLARAVGAEQPEEAARLDVEVEVLDGQQAVVVALGQAADVERCGQLSRLPAGGYLPRSTASHKIRRNSDCVDALRVV